jgi:molybdenum cofactor synthesis domain-containing protein
MTKKPLITACLVVIGNEILSGRTRDSNVHYLAGRLSDLGVRLGEVKIIPDDEGVIVGVLNTSRAAFDYVFTTGGIGPTHDDITSASVAKAFGVALERNLDAVRLLTSHYGKKELNEARLKMADVPAGASLIANPVSMAPGFRIENVFVMAGVPVVMQAMFEGIKDQLCGGAKVLAHTISSNAPEGKIAGPLGDVQARHKEVEIGSYPFFRKGKLGVSLVLRSTEEDLIASAARDVRDLISTEGYELLEGDDV